MLKDQQVLRGQRALKDQRALKAQQVLKAHAGEDGQDGTVDTSNFYNKAQVDFLLMMNTPSIGTYPGLGIRVWDDQQDLMRNLVGQNGVSVSLHGDGIVSSLTGLEFLGLILVISFWQIT